MIDIHAHVIPGIDDGPADLDEARDLVRAAVAAGTTHIVATPHMVPDQYPNTRTSIVSAFAKCKYTLESASGVRLAAAAEVRVGVDTVDLVEREQLPWIGHYDGRPVALLEFPHAAVPIESRNVIRWLVTRGVVPLIAHPERNLEIMQSYHRVTELADLGCLFQLTAASMSGGFGPGAQKTGARMVRDGLVHVLASDMHNTRYRPPALGPGGRVVEKMIGSSAVADLVYDNPWNIAASLFAAEPIDLVV
ncbi:MAG: CpsB/CapC family capsule biosynthesis tyrosine phosphatase [Pseudomonadota bacterium]